MHVCTFQKSINLPQAVREEEGKGLLGMVLQEREHPSTVNTPTEHSAMYDVPYSVRCTQT